MNATQASPRIAREAPPPLALYVHLPWCIAKCPYCDFNSHAHAGELPQASYVDALIEDLDAELPAVWGRRVSSVFIGGGTPSLFSVDSIERLLGALRARLALHPQIEITLEANPGAADVARFEAYVAAGVNRLSVGVQSFDDRALAALGRVHDARAAYQAVDAALASGARSVNIDLMFGLPGQDASAAKRDVRAACVSGVDHVSYYQLTLEPNTAFHRTPPPLPDHDEVYTMHCQGLESLAAAGFDRYEVSAFARDGERCRHNVNYWRFGDYVGIGAGAHGKLTDVAGDAVCRRIKQRLPRIYMDAKTPADRLLNAYQVPPEQLVFEFLLNALRLLDGFDLPLFEQHTGLDRVCLMPVLERAVDDGLLEIDGERVRTSPRGMQFLDELLQRFLPPEH